MQQGQEVRSQSFPLREMPQLMGQLLTRSMDSRQYYDSLAQNYEEENQFWDNPYDNEVWRLEHETIAPYLDPDKPILDVGCGFYPHDSFAPSIRIIAGDISFNSLVVARDHSPKNRRVDLVDFDAHHLPFPDRSFRQVLAGGELFNHIDVDYRKVSIELGRIISPGGFLLVEFGAKWCLDSLWAILDALFLRRIGYSLTRREARSFFCFDGADVRVTWEITPRGDLAVKLLTVSNVRDALRRAGFDIEKLVSTNLMSGIIPLPWQQESDSRLVQALTGGLLRVDRVIGKIPYINRFAGNIFLLCKRRPG
jgi:ubiquinone/menaquinone biosynthesis C-methylase UbiE